VRRCVRLGKLSAELSDDICAAVVVTWTWGGTYCVLRRLRGISSSSSDHSASASPNRFGRSMAGDTVLADGISSWTTSADGHVSLSERKVESRMSGDPGQSARYLESCVWRPPGESVVISTWA
jgi:hypothetical protein